MYLGPGKQVAIRSPHDKNKYFLATIIKYGWDKETNTDMFLIEDETGKQYYVYLRHIWRVYMP